MTSDFAATFAALKPVLGKYEKRLSVKADTPIEYTVLTKSASPFPQHKGRAAVFRFSASGQGVCEFSFGGVVYVPGNAEDHHSRAEEANAREGVLQLQDPTGA